MASSTISVLIAASFLLALIWDSRRCEGFGTYGFDIHHRYSDSVRGVLDLQGLPEKGTVEYYAAMAHRDRIFRSRKLAGTAAAGSTELTFAAGNETYEISSLGYLHYANVSVGSPSLWFLVALDTGSNLFWLPCDCISCLRGSLMSPGHKIDLNVYSPSTSSTSVKASCNNTFCGQEGRCAVKHNACIYEVSYLSTDTSSIGILVEDMLHLTTADSHSKVVNAQITFGCGKIQTGSFLNGAAFNGLFGLGMDGISVPSILTSKGLTANSFSMCFGPDGIGRIIFGDKGSTEQGETPLNVEKEHPIYNISVTRISVENDITELDFTAIFDSGTSFTYLTDPAYSIITDNFNSRAKEKRYQSDSDVPFEYCYELSLNQNSKIPKLYLTMKGGKQFYVTNPIEEFSLQSGGYVYCLAIIRSRDINIIGQNFMRGYRVIFDREKMVLGWQASNCYDAIANTLPIDSQNSSAVPPTSVDPEDSTSGARHGSSVSGPPSLSWPTTQLPLPTNQSQRLDSFTPTLFLVLVSLFLHFFAIQLYNFLQGNKQ
ncbi:Nepenthesin [Bertholletia excelsa]